MTGLWGRMVRGYVRVHVTPPGDVPAWEEYAGDSRMHVGPPPCAVRIGTTLLANSAEGIWVHLTDYHQTPDGIQCWLQLESAGWGRLGNPQRFDVPAPGTVVAQVFQVHERGQSWRVSVSLRTEEMDEEPISYGDIVAHERG